MIFTSSDLKLSVWSLHPKQYTIPIFFPVFIKFYFWLSVFHLLYCWQYFFNDPFLTLWFYWVIWIKFQFYKSFWKIINQWFFRWFLMCLCILFISLKMLKFPSSGLILINIQSSSFSSAFCLSISLLRFPSTFPNSSTSIASLCL